MTDDIITRISGRAGRITLNRPDALNALTHEMASGIQTALDAWRDDDRIDLVIIDAEGERAFCAGGDIALVYRRAIAGDHTAGQRFFADEYRMNATIAGYAKPVIAFMQGFVMGGGVGIAGHCSHRIVCDTTQIAMPECGIGLIPDVGGTWLLAHAPGATGEYLGLTGARMGPGDAIWAGFADRFIPAADWPDAIAALEATGDVTTLPQHPQPASPLKSEDLAAFTGPDLEAIRAAVPEGSKAAKALGQNSELSMRATLRMIRAARNDASLCESLARELRFTYRATQSGDFIEGVRAQIIDKDRAPKWAAPSDDAAVDAMLADLGSDELWAERNDGET